MNIAIIGSSGYIAKFLIDRLEKEPYVQKILKIDQNVQADVHLNLQEYEKFNYEILNDI